MPRRRVVTKREILPDPKYSNKLVARFINNLLKRGKKSIAESILYGAFDIIQDRIKEPPVDVFEKAITNVKPVIEVKSRRVGGSTYQVPTEVRPTRQQALAMRWLIDAARKRGEKSMALRPAGEIGDASASRGAAVKKREDTHRMAEANKAFSHYRW